MPSNIFVLEKGHTETVGFSFFLSFFFFLFFLLLLPHRSQFAFLFLLSFLRSFREHQFTCAVVVHLSSGDSVRPLCFPDLLPPQLLRGQADCLSPFFWAPFSHASKCRQLVSQKKKKGKKRSAIFLFLRCSIISVFIFIIVLSDYLWGWDVDLLPCAIF